MTPCESVGREHGSKVIADLLVGPNTIPTFTPRHFNAWPETDRAVARRHSRNDHERCVRAVAAASERSYPVDDDLTGDAVPISPMGCRDLVGDDEVVERAVAEDADVHLFPIAQIKNAHAETVDHGPPPLPDRKDLPPQHRGPDRLVCASRYDLWSVCLHRRPRTT